METTFNISEYPQAFRIKKMNAIEFFAMRTQIDFENYDNALQTLNLILEKIEVQVDNDQWLPVKDRMNYFPAGIEDNINAINEIVKIFMREFKAVFQKSSASNE